MRFEVAVDVRFPDRTGTCRPEMRFQSAERRSGTPSAEEDVERLPFAHNVLVAELRVPVAELRIEDDEPALVPVMPKVSLKDLCMP